MNEPKLDWTPELAEKYKKRYGNYPSGYKLPKAPTYSDKEEAALRIQEQSFRGLPVKSGSIYPGSYIARMDSSITGEYDRLEAKQKEKHDVSKFNIDYQTKLLNLREKQKEAGVGLEDISKKRSEFFKKIEESQNILNKTVKSTKIDKEGVEYDVEKPAYPYQARQQAKETVSAYSDSIRTLKLVEKLRGQGIQANMSDVVSFFKKAEKPIDAMTQEMIKKGFTKEQALVFKNTAMEIVKEGNSPETAMKRAAEHINIMFGDIFNKE